MRLRRRCSEHIELVHAVKESPKSQALELQLTFAEGQKLLREEEPENCGRVRDREHMSTPQEEISWCYFRNNLLTDCFTISKSRKTRRFSQVDGACICLVLLNHVPKARVFIHHLPAYISPRLFQVNGLTAAWKWRYRSGLCVRVVA